MRDVILLLIAVVIWGMGFIGTKWTFTAYDPIWSNAIRFAIAGILILPYLFIKKSHKLAPRLLLESALLGLILSLALNLQNFGIQLTSMAKVGFFTTFYVIFTPILETFFLGKRLAKSFWFLVFLALVGVAFLCDLKLDNLNLGDLLTLFSALMFAFQILLIDRLAKKMRSGIELNFLQIFFSAVFSLVIALVYHGPTNLEPLFRFSEIGQASPISGFILVAIFSSLIAYTIQVIAQKKIPPHLVSLIFLLESPMASFFGYVFLGETLTRMALFGCSLILLSVGLSFTKPFKA